MEFAYVGYCKCGALVAATMDDPDHKKQVAKDVAEFIRWGLRVERVDSELVREQFSHCTCEEESMSLPMFPEL